MAHWASAWKHLDRIPEVARCVGQDAAPLRTIGEYLRLRAFAPRRLVLRNGAKLDLQTWEDLATAWIVFFRREYAVPPDAATVLDLGANIGSFTLLVAAQQPAARLVSLEPFPPTFARLTATLRLNALESRVHAWPVGVAARAGQRVIPAADAPSQSLGMVAADSAAASAPGGTTIEVLSLEEIIDRACATLDATTIDFAKMDVEGAEHESLRAVPATALKRLRGIGMEYHPNDDKAGLFAALTDRGFALVHDRPINAGSGIAHFRLHT